MAMLKRPNEALPSDAVLITENEAFVIQMKFLEDWPNKSEIWAMRFGPTILGAMSAINSAYINSHYRNKLKLGTYGKMSSYLPIVALPAVMSIVYHKGFIQKSVVLQQDKCPLCTQLRAASYQTIFSNVYPIILAPLASFMFATRHFTYRLPSITEKPMEVFHLWRKLTKPLAQTLGASIIINGLFAMYLTYKEMQQSYHIQSEMVKIGTTIDDENQI